jgi:hypothetical protein
MPDIQRTVAAITACSIAFTAALALAADGPATLVSAAETAYADAMDAAGIVGTIDSGLVAAYGGGDRNFWLARQHAQAAEFQKRIAQVPSDGLAAADKRAVAIMRRKIAALMPGEGDSLQPTGRCADASDSAADYATLRAALYACFDELGNAIEFDGAKLTRVAALGKLSELESPVDRERLFAAFDPLWRAVNARNEPDSPYRRVIRMAADEARRDGSAIDAAARTLGVSAVEVERWLERVLDAWRVATARPPVEPWDYRYAAGAADRALRSAIPKQDLAAINERYYRDLGADLAALGALYDLEPRPGKAPLAYADYVTRGRTIDGAWRPTVVRVSGSYATGGLGLLNELVHENGHVVHMMALHTRPAFMDLGDPVFYEAFADVPAWNTHEPAWQRRYLGQAVDEPTALEGLYAGVMLDVAWALFEAKMLRDPQADPNALWTDITSRYLHVRPHPELAWWAVRVQLVDSPGYMVNYGLGAVVTADLRQRIHAGLGRFETGDARWYGWLGEQLLKDGEALDTAELLRRFLGRPVTPDALLAEIARIEPRRAE